jgi:hypothetical protein
VTPTDSARSDSAASPHADPAAPSTSAPSTSVFPSSADEAVLLPVADDETAPDGLAAELAKAAPRRWHNRATLPLVGLVLVAGGFLGGALTERQTGTSQQTAGRNFPAGGFAAGGGTNGGGFGQRSGATGGNAPGGADGAGAPGTTGGATGAGAAGATTGTVKLVQGSTIYVETADGTVVTVKTGKGTSVRTSASAKLSDIKAGAKITVQGTAAGEDTVSATAVTKQ